MLVVLRHHDELLGIGCRKRAEEHRTGDAEHRRGDPDADRQGQRRCGREAGVPRQAADAEPQIAPKVVQPGPSPRIAALLPQPERIAESPVRGRARLVGRHPPIAELLLEECQMQLHFLVDVALDLPASNERPEPPSERAEHRHGCPPIRPCQPLQ